MMRTWVLLALGRSEAWLTRAPPRVVRARSIASAALTPGIAAERLVAGAALEAEGWVRGRRPYGRSLVFDWYKSQNHHIS